MCLTGLSGVCIVSGMENEEKTTYVHNNHTGRTTAEIHGTFIVGTHKVEIKTTTDISFEMGGVDITNMIERLRKAHSIPANIAVEIYSVQFRTR